MFWCLFSCSAVYMLPVVGAAAAAMPAVFQCCMSWQPKHAQREYAGHYTGHFEVAYTKL